MYGVKNKQRQDNMKTDCKHIKSRLSAYLDKQVDDVTKNLIESHITECKDCAEYLKNITDAEIIITAPLSKTPVFDTNSARRIFWDKTVKKAKAEGRFLFFLHKYAGTFAIILILLLFFINE